MDVLAEFASAGEALLPQPIIAKCTRAGDDWIDWEPGHEYSAAMDPATRNNAWTLVVCDKVRRVLPDGSTGAVKRVVYARQWQGSQVAPLQPVEVLTEVAGVLAHYKLGHVNTDQWGFDFIQALARQLGFGVVLENWTSEEQTRHYLGLRAAMTDGLIEIPKDSVFQKDLRLVRRVVGRNANGRISIHLSSTADGRHCDYAPAFMRAVSRWIEADEAPRPAPGTPAALKEEINAMRERAFARVRKSIIAKRHPLTHDEASMKVDDEFSALLERRGEGDWF